LTELSIQRGKLIQEKQNDNQKLVNKISELEKSITNLKDKFESESEKVNANAQIQKLRQELSDMEVRNYELRLEYEAFKKHSMGLLEKERDLNSKLRFLVH